MGRNCGHAAAILGRAFLRTQAGACRHAANGDGAAGLAVRDLHFVSDRLHDGRSQRQPGRTGNGEIDAGATATFFDGQRFVDAGLRSARVSVSP